MPKVLTVSGYLDLSCSLIKKLPRGFILGGSLDLSESLIRKLPKRFTVGRSLLLSQSLIRKLPKKMSVGGFLQLTHSKIKRIPKDLIIGDNLYLNNNIKKLNDSIKIGGMIYGPVNLNENNKLVEGECKNGKYLFADGILTFITSIKKVKGYTYYKGLFKDRNVLYDGKYYAHCKNFKHGVQDLLFKEAKNRGVEQYKTLSLNDVVSTSELITMYRIITGACKQGTETFVKSLGKKLKNKYTVKEAIELTKGQYGSNDFKNFFKK